MTRLEGEQEAGAVTVLPVGVQLAVLAGETVFAAAQRLGYRWPTICGGKGQCTACHMLVVAGATNLSAVEQPERERLDSLSRIVSERGEWRLACQTRAHGVVTVEKIGVKKRGSAARQAP